jgi:flagellar protein FliL
MAKQPEPSAAPAPEGAPAKKKKPILIIAIAAIVVLAGGGAAAWFLLGGKHDKDAEHAEAEALKPPVYVTLEPFTVNLTSEATDRYLQVGIDLKVSAADITEKVKVHLPEIRNGILLLLTSKKVDDLASIEGKNTLREEIRDIVNKSIGYYKAPAVPKPTIEKTEEQGGEKPAEEKADEKPAEEAAGEKPAAKPPKNGVIDVLLTSFVIQ